MTTSVHSSLATRMQRLLSNAGFERQLAIAILFLAALTYFFLPHSFYRLLGVFTTEPISRLLAVLVTFLSIIWVILYLRRYLVRDVKRVLLAIFMQITFAGSTLIFLLMLPFIVEFTLLAAGSFPIILLVTALVILWLLPQTRKGGRGMYLLRTVTLLVALSVPIYFALRLIVEPRFIIGDDLAFADHHYYLASEMQGVEGRRDTFLVLFECNQWAIACRDVYEMEMIGYDQIADFTLATDEAEEVVTIYREDQPVTTYKPGSGTPLGHAIIGVRRDER